MREFKKRIPFEQATKFRVEYVCYLHNDLPVQSRTFNSAASLAQWVTRNDNDNTFGIKVLRRLALLGDQWEPYTTIGRKTITLTDLRTIVKDLEMTI